MESSPPCSGRSLSQEIRCKNEARFVCSFCSLNPTRRRGVPLPPRCRSNSVGSCERGASRDVASGLYVRNWSISNRNCCRLCLSLFGNIVNALSYNLVALAFDYTVRLRTHERGINAGNGGIIIHPTLLLNQNYVQHHSPKEN